MPAAMPTAIEPGLPFPLGVTLRDGGINVAVYAEHATRVELCLFDDANAAERIRLDLAHQTHGVWHGFVPGVGAVRPSVPIRTVVRKTPRKVLPYIDFSPQTP